MPESINYSKAVMDFHEARRKADLQMILSRLRGETNELLSYEEVRQALKAVEGNQKKLTEIPLDAIIGSVGRYTDFTRDFLPRRDTDQHRWSTVMEKTIGMEGLPPIEVYKIGDAYFVQDGNHRVSVARQLGANQIQAYVREVQTKIPLSSEIQPDQLILVAEQLNFIEHTKIDRLRPKADLKVTIPGQYPILEEHISVHQYFMGIDEQRDIRFEEAVTHWYDQVYLPVVDVIRKHRILEFFPNRTEADLYLWISKHKADLERSLGWKIDTPEIANDLVFSFSSNIHARLSKLANRILDIFVPDPLETGPPAGHWRRKYIEQEERDCSCLFRHIIVPLVHDTAQWQALDQALIISHREDAQLRGLHVVQNQQAQSEPYIKEIKAEFDNRCRQQRVSGDLAIEIGGITRTICDRAHWADLIISLLAHPPGDSPIKRLGSGFRTLIRRCPRPIMAVPCKTTQFKHLLLAYSNSPKAQEALFITAYMGSKWNSHITILTMDEDDESAKDIQSDAKEYLQKLDVPADYICLPGGHTAQKIIEQANVLQADTILMGGYKTTPLVEIVVGSVVDQVLRDTPIPVLLCR